LEELSKYFDEVILITNERDIAESEIDYCLNHQIKLKMVVNEGFDFGMWYKGLSSIDALQYDRIALVNDSCVLFRPLDDFFRWADSCDLDYCGMVDSIDVSYHIQSYFVVVNKKAIPSVVEYFEEKGLISTTDIWDIVVTYELGLSAHLLKAGYKLGARFSGPSYLKNAKTVNPIFYGLESLLLDGLPIIKKVVLLDTYRQMDLFGLWRSGFRSGRAYYRQIIRGLVDNSAPNIDQLLQDQKCRTQKQMLRARVQYWTHFNVLLFLRRFVQLEKVGEAKEALFDGDRARATKIVISVARQAPFSLMTKPWLYLIKRIIQKNTAPY
jgi:hypothetical protein